MNDMSGVITPKSDQINADDLLVGPMTITIREVSIRSGQDQPVSIRFDGEKKVYRPCKSMSRVMVACWGPDASQYVGRSMTLYCDPEVKWGGLAVGGIRISHMSHIQSKQTLALTTTKGQRKPIVILPLVIQQPTQPAPTKSKQERIAEVDAMTDAPALQQWLDEHKHLEAHQSQAARDVYTHAQSRLTAILDAIPHEPAQQFK